MITLAKYLVVLGLILVVLGGAIYLLSRFEIPLGRLPGDIRVERGNFTCMIALGTSILLSIILTVVLNILIRVLNK
jgi:hypothetical protein